MKTELMNIEGKGICIVISDINPNDLGGIGVPYYQGIGNIRDGNICDVHAIADEIRKGRKIAAIKELRAQTGWGLREAKHYIDEYSGSLAYGSNGLANSRCAERFINDHTPENLLNEDEFKV
jgi:hypothetical protein